MSYSTLSKISSRNVYCEPSAAKDPMSMCLVETADRRMQFGGEVGRITGPRSANCQSFLSQRCANKWDGFCEYVYSQYGENAPEEHNRTPVINPLYTKWEATNGYALPQPIGEHLVHNTAKEKYCTFSDCLVKEEPFSPFVAHGAQIKTYHGRCVPTCKVDPSTIDNDPVMNRALANPTVNAVTLINICNTSRREGTDLSGTKIGALCQNYFKNLGE